jgi:hypothetical protein
MVGWFRVRRKLKRGGEASVATIRSRRKFNFDDY